MKNKLSFLVLLILLNVPAFSQNNTGDSLYTGRICKIVLYNGFETEGIIRQTRGDTLKLETGITNLFIPVKDIKFVMDTSIVIFDREEQERKNTETDIPEVVKPGVVKVDTAGECDIYMSERVVLKNVKVILDTDSTLKIVKGSRSSIINITGIRKIVFKPVTPFGYGYLFGSAAGFISGFVTIAAAGYIGYGIFAGFICSIPLGLIGGVVGLVTAKDEVHLFNDGIYAVKIKRIRYLVEKHY